MTDDEATIRALIDRWAKAVHVGDMDAVLADHTDDIVMFDVPPPNEVRGKAAYRDTWPPFFEYQRRGAVFEIASLEGDGRRRCRLRARPASLWNRGRLPPGPRQPASAHPRFAQVERPLGGRARTSFVPAAIS